MKLSPQVFKFKKVKGRVYRSTHEYGKHTIIFEKEKECHGKKYWWSLWGVKNGIKGRLFGHGNYSKTHMNKELHHIRNLLNNSMQNA